MESNRKMGCGGIIALIGLVAGIIGIFTFLTGYNSLPQILNQPVSQPQSRPILPSTVKPNVTNGNTSQGAFQGPGRLLFVYDGSMVEMRTGGAVTPLFVAPKSQASQLRMQWSPDGRRLAYLKDQNTIVVADSDGTNGQSIDLNKITGQPGDWSQIDVEDFVWSEDGSKILFGSSAPYGLGVIDVNSKTAASIGGCNFKNGIGPRHIAWASGLGLVALWSAEDHKVIARSMTSNGDDCDVWLDNFTTWGGPLTFVDNGAALIYADKVDLYRIPQPGTSGVKVFHLGQIDDITGPSAMAKSPDGRSVAMSSSFGIFVLDIVTGNITKVFDGSDKHLEGTSLSWLP